MAGTYDTLDEMLNNLGMEILGDFLAGSGEITSFATANIAYTGILIASCGSQMWPHFYKSSEFEDAEGDPLNRWSARVLGAIAQQFDAKLALPFKKPYQPFQQWAERAGGLTRSPLGMLIHPVYGLWFGLRGVLFFPTDQVDLSQLMRTKSSDSAHDICGACLDKPCLKACPVNAFGDDGLNVNACFSHLDSIAAPDCMSTGCAARAACPVAPGHTYGSDQLQFHMRAFRG